MRSNCLISIIVPIYNIEKYIDDCIISARKQSYKNLEIILINDGSSDGSLSICEKHASEDNRIKIFNKQNGGLSDARNYGTRMASGDYVFYLDGDDLLQENTIEVLFSAIKNKKDCISICSYEEFISDWNYSSVCQFKDYSPKDYCKSVLELNNNTFAWGTLIPRRMIPDDLFVTNRYYEDMASMYKVYSKCKKIVRVNCALYKYRRNPNSITKNINEKKICDYRKSCHEFFSFVSREYHFDERKTNIFICNVYRTCYVMARDDTFLRDAKRIIRNTSLKGLSSKNRIKLFFLRSVLITKWMVLLKNGKKAKTIIGDGE